MALVGAVTPVQIIILLFHVSGGLKLAFRGFADNLNDNPALCCRQTLTTSALAGTDGGDCLTTPEAISPYFFTSISVNVTYLSAPWMVFEKGCNRYKSLAIVKPCATQRREFHEAQEQQKWYHLELTSRIPFGRSKCGLQSSVESTTLQLENSRASSRLLMNATVQGPDPSES